MTMPPNTNPAPEAAPAMPESLLSAAKMIPPDIAAAQRAFRRDLAQLLGERAGQWVAYHGDRRLGFGRTKTHVYQDCLRQGYAPGQFLVRLIGPQPDERDALGPFEPG
jgi:hypothetical protein